MVNGTTPVAEVPDNLKILQQAFDPARFGPAIEELQAQRNDPARPASHLNYVLMDDDMNVIGEQSGALQIKGKGFWDQVAKDGEITVAKTGYLTVFTSSKDLILARWDVVKLTQYRGNMIEENFYYPFGLTLTKNGPMTQKD